MATKNMFSGVGGSEDGGGGVGPSGVSTSGDYARIEERDDAEMSWGPPGNPMSRYMPFDAAAARTERQVRIGASTNRVVALEEVQPLAYGLMQHCGVAGQSDGVQSALFDAMLLCHAKNSASQVQPGRARFWIEGGPKIHFFEVVVNHLGDDTRRFFRAYASAQRAVIRRILDRYKAGNESYAEDYRDIMWVAHDRGLTRYPDLIGDGADACFDLTLPERNALSMAKATIFANTQNVVDLVQMHRVNKPQPRVHNYDSSVAEE